MPNELRANCAAYLRCLTIKDGFLTSEKTVNNDLLLAHNDCSIIQLNLTELYLTVLHADYNRLDSFSRCHWQQYLPRLLDDADVGVVCYNYFRLLLRNEKTDRYWLHARRSCFPIDCVSLQQTFQSRPLCCVFLRGDEALALLFENQLRIDKCADWWHQSTVEPKHTAAVAESQFTTLLSDNVSHIIAYGPQNIACYNAKLVRKWSRNARSSGWAPHTLALCWLSSVGFIVFCLLDNGTLCALHRADGTECAESIQLAFEPSEFNSLKAFRRYNLDKQHYLVAQNSKTLSTRVQIIECLNKE